MIEEVATRGSEEIMAKNVVFIVTRATSERTAVLLVTDSLEKADAFVDAHVRFRVEREGATAHLEQRYEPAPVPAGAMNRVGGSEGHPVLVEADPVVACFRRDVTLIERGGERTLYRVAQYCVQ